MCKHSIPSFLLHAWVCCILLTPPQICNEIKRILLTLKRLICFALPQSTANYRKFSNQLPIFSTNMSTFYSILARPSMNMCCGKVKVDVRRSQVIFVWFHVIETLFGTCTMTGKSKTIIKRNEYHISIYQNKDASYRLCSVNHHDHHQCLEGIRGILQFGTSTCWPSELYLPFWSSFPQVCQRLGDAQVRQGKSQVALLESSLTKCLDFRFLYWHRKKQSPSIAHIRGALILVLCFSPSRR